MTASFPRARPKLLDLFCCAGGAAMGYHRAGFDVYGVDKEAQPNYPFPIYVSDAIAALAHLMGGGRLRFTRPDGSNEWLSLGDFDAIHGSPPCQPYSTGVSSRSSKWVPTLGKDEPALIGDLHDLLQQLDVVPWVIENVMGARPAMPAGFVVVCGSMFDLLVPRHRVLASNVPLNLPEHPNCRGLAKRSAAELGWDYRDMSVTGKGRRAGTTQRWQQLLGIDWHMTQHELAEAIPPAYTEHVGRHLIEVVLSGKQAQSA